jgi:hypothetical protein
MPQIHFNNPKSNTPSLYQKTKPFQSKKWFYSAPRKWTMFKHVLHQKLLQHPNKLVKIYNHS